MPRFIKRIQSLVKCRVLLNGYRALLNAALFMIKYLKIIQAQVIFCRIAQIVRRISVIIILY